MQEDYIITISGFMNQNGEKDSIELVTRGNFIIKKDKYFICYKNTEESGLGDTTTTVKVESKDKISLIRFGNMPSHLIVEKGKRHVCHYDTGFGVMNLGIATSEVHNNLTENGGNLEFSYTLDSDNRQISNNVVKIMVQEAN